MASTTYVDLQGNLHKVRWTDVFAAADRIQKFFNVVGLRFVEREEMLSKLMYAMMMREHMLIDGPTGAAKSYLLDTVMGNIVDAQVWAMDLTKFTNEAHLFGAYDVRAMREDGHMIHMTEGSLAEANFAKTGEFFDASDATLRTLLGVMNERKIRRGPQLLDLPLLTLVADTNFRPEDMPHRSHQLAAVVDRFLFRHHVGYVQEPRNRYTMLEMALENTHKTPLPKLTLQDVVLVSGVVRACDLVTDRYVREAYQQMTWEFSQARQAHGRPPLSDRRYVRAAQIMEVAAILHRRTVCTFDDLQYTRHILLQHEGDEEIFDEARHKALEKWVAAAQRREVEAELHGLEAITKRIPEPDLSQMTHAQLTKLREGLEAIRVELMQFNPQAIEVRDIHTKAVTRILRMLAHIDIAQIAVLSKLPELGEGPDPQQLHALAQHCKHVESELRKITPRSDEAIIAHAQALEQVGRMLADIQVEFMGKGKGS